jgi:hypothetical protein
MKPKKRTLMYLWKELFGKPWFTILFASEAINLYVVAGYVFTPLVGEFLKLTAFSALVWVLSDAIDIREEVLGFDGGQLQSVDADTDTDPNTSREDG